MKVTVFHGSPRKGNTYKATKIFMEELTKCGEVEFVEYFLPQAIPKFCTGCQLCMGNPHERCPHAEYISPILESVLTSDALIFTTPHHGGCTMSSGMKNLLDHLDFLTMTVSPHKEIFSKKAFIITTATGSAAAIKTITNYLRNWGINRVSSLGLRMFIDKWDKMPAKKQDAFKRKLQKKARKFYNQKKKRPYLKTVFMYHIFKFIIKKYIGEGNYPYEYWKSQNYFHHRPF